MEQLEVLCDEVAFAIDDAKGAMSPSTVDGTVTKILEGTDFNVDQFTKLFTNIYECSPHQYTLNSSEDEDWARNTVIDLETFDDPDDYQDDNLSAFGLEMETFGPED